MISLTDELRRQQLQRDLAPGRVFQLFSGGKPGGNFPGDPAHLHIPGQHFPHALELGINQGIGHIDFIGFISS